jgi:hypothetical protein
MRLNASLADVFGKGTITRTGLTGHLACASALPEMNAATAAITVQKFFMWFSSVVRSRDARLSRALLGQ